MEISRISPNESMVLVRLLDLEGILGGLIATQASDADAVAPKYGEVISMGDSADKHGNCTGLVRGDIVVFTEFAGYHVVSESTTEMYKLVRGYDIIGKCMTQKDIDNLNITPTENRVMVESFNVNKDDIILNNAKDPRSLDLNYGKIISVGDNVQNKLLVPGTVVAFAGYVGTMLRGYESDEIPAISVLVEHDILLTIA